MLSLTAESGKVCEPQFQEPPWSTESRQWQQLDAEIPSDHEARRLIQAVDRLDLHELRESYSAGGSAALPPLLMLKIIVVEMRRGRTRPSQWFKDTRESSVLKWIGFGLQPSRSSWYNFRDRLGPLIENWFSQTLRIAGELGVTSATRGALDGTLVPAHASRHRLLNKERLDKRRVELNAACDKDRAGIAPETVPSWMSKTPRTRAMQRERYDRAYLRLLDFQAVNQRHSSTRRRLDRKIVVSVSEPEAAIGWDKQKVFRPVYNVQVLRDLDSNMTLAYEVFPQSNDGGTLKPMLNLARDKLHLSLSTLLCDASYITATNLALCHASGVSIYGPWQEKGVGPEHVRRTKKKSLIPKTEFVWRAELDQYRCPEGHALTSIGKDTRLRIDGEVNVMHRYRCSPKHCQTCARRQECTTNPARGRAISRSEYEDLITIHRARMAQAGSREIYRLRKQTVELEYADLKHNRDLRTFSGFGLARARIEVGLHELSHNLATVQNWLETHSKAKTPGEAAVAYAS